jgi:hypothetical protein
MARQARQTSRNLMIVGFMPENILNLCCPVGKITFPQCFLSNRVLETIEFPYWPE